ncbi:MAG: VacB/RNase II family 3'-5' exoribonuclease [Polyangiales bacterium]
MRSIDTNDILDVLRERAPRALHVAEIASRLGLPKQEKDRVSAALDRMVEEGSATEMPGNRYRLPKGKRPLPVPPPPERTKTDRPKKSHVVEPRPRGRADGPRSSAPGAGRVGGGDRFAGGDRSSAPRSFQGRGQGDDRFGAPRMQPLVMVRGVLTLHPRGFAFVAADDGGPDVFVPEPYVGAALHGDRVEVDARPSARGREGAVIGILARRDPRITGSLRHDHGRWNFFPDDPRLRAPMHVQGEIPAAAKQGDAVVAELVVFPQRVEDRATVVVKEHLGVQGLTAVEVTKIKIREGVVEEFPEPVRLEAKRVPASVSDEEAASRTDLRDVGLVTIDPDDARDHDDALWGERTERGFRLLIAIADVSAYVREGTAIDAEAMARCTSIYLPDRAIPMLPPEISSNIASLVPNKDRLCLAVEVELSKHGDIRSYKFVEGVMRSRARLTYGSAARALGLTKEGTKQKEADKHLPTLEALLEASRVLRKKRLARGALDFDLPEAKVKLDRESGEPVDVERSRKDPGVREAYRLVEEMMLLANEIVAADLTERGVPAIYRVHGRPDDKKIQIFCELAHSMGHDLDPEDASDPKILAGFLSHIEESPEAPVLRYLLLRSMQQASYDVNPDIGHFGLAARDYLHFTSPIRRYPDLAVHRVVRKVVRGEAIDGAMLWPRLRMMAAESSRLERRAMSVERDVVKLYAAILMRERVGDVFDASISAVESHGFHVTLDAPFVECWVPLEELPHDRYELDDLGLRLTSWSGHSYGLGDRIRVRIRNVGLERREVVAVPEFGESVEGLSEARGPARRKRSRAPGEAGRERGHDTRGPSREEQTSRRGRHQDEARDRERRAPRAQAAGGPERTSSRGGASEAPRARKPDRGQAPTPKGGPKKGGAKGATKSARSKKR